MRQWPCANKRSPVAADLQCGRVEMAAFDAGLGKLAGADCVIVFGGELQVLPAWMDSAAAARAASGSRKGRDRPVRIEIEPAARRHPVLEGVEPFVSRLDAPERDGLPGDATVLLSEPERRPAPRRWLGCKAAMAGRFTPGWAPPRTSGTPLFSACCSTRWPGWAVPDFPPVPSA